MILLAEGPPGWSASLAQRSLLLRPDTGLVSFTFDGFPVSAGRSGARVLEDASVRGTFYTAAGTWGQPTGDETLAGLEEVDELHSRGHEIGCYTFSGQALARSSTARSSEVERSAASFREGQVDRRFSSFAYPGGAAGRRVRRDLGRRFATCRSQSPGTNRGRVDLAYLRSVALTGVGDADGGPVEAWFERLRRDGGWLIFHTRDVSESPTADGCSPALLAYAVARARALDLEVLPVRHALARAAFG